MNLSDKAVRDLKTALRISYGEDFVAALSDEEVNKIGMLLLTCLMEGLKL